MYQAQGELITKLILYRDILLDNPAVWEQNPHLQPHIENFLNSLNIILKTIEIMEENNKTLATYNQLKDELIRSALNISRNVTAYSLLEEIADVQGMFCFTFDELSQETDDKIILNCRKLSQFIANFRSELIDYGINDSIEKKLVQLTEQFQVVFETKKIQNISTFNSEKYFTNLMNDTIMLLEEKVKPICNELEIKSN